MKLALKQNSIGRFNFCGNEKTLEVSIGIVDDNYNYIKEGENEARIKFSIEDNLEREQKWIEDEFNNFEIEDLLQRAKDYISRIWSTVDYKGDMNLFLKVFIENIDEITKKHKDVFIKKYQEKIKYISDVCIDKDTLLYYEF